MAVTRETRLRVWTLADIVGIVKYPLWTMGQFFVHFPLAVRNTAFILSAFARTAHVGYRAIRVLDRQRAGWTDRTRGRYIWRVARLFWADWIMHRAQIGVDVVGSEGIDWSKPHIVVSNHQSTLDILVLVKTIPYGRYVAKKEVLAFPFVGSACVKGAQIIVDRKDHAQSMQAIRKGMEDWPDCNLIFFAEGTRSRDGRLGTFKKGGFAIARETGLPIIPVAITGAFEALPRGSLLRLQRGRRMRIEFGKPIPSSADVAGLAERTREVIGEMICRADAPLLVEERTVAA